VLAFSKSSSAVFASVVSLVCNGIGVGVGMLIAVVTITGAGARGVGVGSAGVASLQASNPKASSKNNKTLDKYLGMKEALY
jgi:hypothetical protein